MSKTTINAQIIADSKNQFGDRITTFVLQFPRHILAELNTHRMFSRNSASSRAIPFKKMLKRVETDPFIPIAWQKDHKGMQGSEYFEKENEINARKNAWLTARDHAVANAVGLSGQAVTKQLCNRLLEPFMWHTAIVTATEFENFFHLRCPQYEFGPDGIGECLRSKKDWCKVWRAEFDENIDQDTSRDLFWHKINKGAGEIHIMALAEAMWDAMNESTPKELKAGEWHIPFGNQFNEEKLYKLAEKEDLLEVQKGGEFSSLDKEELMIKIATARCARVSWKRRLHG